MNWELHDLEHCVRLAIVDITSDRCNI